MTVRTRGARRAAALVVALTLAVSCTTRERLNPLDPKNEQTQGGLVGFDAIAADSVVEFRWPALALEGLLGYRVLRSRPGGPFEPLGSTYPPRATAGEDPTARNDSTYIYRLVAHFELGDSAVSPADTATPGVRRILVLTASPPAFTRLSPDARDVLFARAAFEPYEDMELDRRNALICLALEGEGVVIRKTPDGATLTPALPVPSPVDVSVSNNRGICWVASAEAERVVAFGPDLADPNPSVNINVLGHPRVVEAGTADLRVWIGTDEGWVYWVRPQDGVQTDPPWILGAGGVRAIALDEPSGAAWVTTRLDATSSLYYLAAGDTTRQLVRGGLSNVVDLAVNAETGDLWVAERGAPTFGAGRVSRLARNGATLVSLSGVEPYGIDVDPLDGSCWISDLRSGRVLQLDENASVIRSTPLLDTPYAVRIQLP